MDIKMTQTFHLPADTVKKIIVEYFIKLGYKVTTDDVNISVGRRTEGYGPMEHDVICFEECTVTVKGE